MVDQSELPWRLLSRRYGAQLCYTPMFHAFVFKRDAHYRRENLVSCPEDRPLIVQFCANDPETLLEAAKYAQPFCDAIDLNLGCPQTIAKKGHYGAFLQDEWDLLSRMVSLLHRELSVPVTCKIRVFEDIDKTVRYAKMLEASGCQLLTVHGRLREQKGEHTGLASWKHIAAVKQAVSIPVFANGNIQFFKDVETCLEATKADGVMTAEGNLHNPALFTGEHPPCWKIAEEYLQLVRDYPCPLPFVRGHLFKLWFHVLKQLQFESFRDELALAKSVDALEAVSLKLKALVLETLSEDELNDSCPKDGSSIPFWRCQPNLRSLSASEKAPKRPRPPPESDGSVVQESKKKKYKERGPVPVKRKEWSVCTACSANPKGQRCAYNMCKCCCREKCRSEGVECIGHYLFNKPRAKRIADVNTCTTLDECQPVGTAEEEALQTADAVT
eukprot:Em0020g824a